MRLVRVHVIRVRHAENDRKGLGSSGSRHREGEVSILDMLRQSFNVNASCWTLYDIRPENMGA